MHAVVINATITDRDALPTALSDLVPIVSQVVGTDVARIDSVEVGE